MLLRDAPPLLLKSIWTSHIDVLGPLLKSIWTSHIDVLGLLIKIISMSPHGTLLPIQTQ
jgi:hypothetical protein